jgi:hypothetical protein
MMRKSMLVAFLAASCGILFLSSTTFAADNWLGTWKMNAAKSKFSPGPAPKSQTLTWQASDAGIKFSSEGVDDQGKATHTSFVSKYDGRDVPYEGNPNADTASPKRIDANSYLNTWKMGGKVTISAKVVVSADGKTLTVTQKGKDAKGQALEITAVYDKE